MIIEKRHEAKGFDEEAKFLKTMREHNFDIDVSTPNEDYFAHIDFWFIINGEKKSIDLKNNFSRIVVNGRPIKGFYLELFNRFGNKGSIDGEANYLTITYMDDYVFFYREDLRTYLKDKLEDMTIYKKTNNVYPYTIYSRVGRKDQIVFVPANDVEHLEQFRIKR